MQLDLRQIWNGIRKRWWLALLVMLSAAGVAYFYTNAQPRVYQAQATIAAQPLITSQEANAMIEALKKTMPTYAQELGNKRLWAEAIDNALIRDVDMEALGGQVKVQARPDQNGLVMTVDNGEALKAALVAEVIAEEFVARQEAKNQDLTVSNRLIWMVTQAPEPPSAPYQPRPLLFSGAAALFGLILGLLLVVGLELLDTTLKTPTDVTQYTGLSTLGIIPRR